ncbi:MAG: 4-hydroxythreonine-4-phosphate dehydrogenase PdxA [Chromatiales bacterium]|nr:4-hydroxythreonine-4-phosphate dehydrogenase PdxA [Chromatiales bacterium]
MKIIAITAGEPAGIGPDLLVTLAHTPMPDVSLVIIGNNRSLLERANQIGKCVTIDNSSINQPHPHLGDGVLSVVNVPLKTPVIAGTTDPCNAQQVVEQLNIAVQGCRTGKYDALVTAPVNKAAICRAGISFSGHTEYLAQACRCDSVMLLETKGLRVALATTHIPLSAVPQSISYALLKETINILHDDLSTRFKINAPRIAVCGLNPHAGEQGYLGNEESKVIAPAIKACADEGMSVFGPLSADTAFTPEQLAQCDVVLAMYHDQGLAVIKSIGFRNIVNITLGLPFVRTSVDHGTALELAGSGRADAHSLLLAVRRAIELSS